MLAVTFRNQTLALALEEPEPNNEGEVILDLLMAGVCETDLQLIQGYMGFEGVLGHEFVATALAGKFQGKRVVGEINCPCHECLMCKQGMGNHCPRRSVLGILNRSGAFAQRLSLPESNLHEIPSHVSNEHAVFVEPLAAAFQIGRQVDLREHSRVAVVGDGRLGYLCAQVLRMAGCSVLVIGKHAHKLARFVALDFEVALHSDLTRQRDRSLVVECTGSITGIPTAMKYLAPRGILVQKTTISGEVGPSMSPIVIDEISLIGSRCGPFEPAIDAIARGEIELDSLITSRFRLLDGVTAVQRARDCQELKVLIEH